MKKIEEGVRLILEALQQEFGLDLMNENFKDTPARVARAYTEIFSGLKDTQVQIDKVLSSKFPSEGYDQMVISSGNKVFSMCPHHLLPVEYDIDLAYIPSKKGFVLGISKLSRIAQILARRPVLQEQLTKEIGESLGRVEPEGTMVRVKGIHYCMRMRGVRQLASTITSYNSGSFKDNVATREEFLSLIQRGTV